MKDTDLNAALLGEPTISSQLADQKIYIGKLPQGALLPAIVAELPGTTKPAGSGETVLRDGEIMLRLYAGQRATVRQLDGAVTRFLEGYSGAFGTTSITGTSIAFIERTLEEKQRRYVSILKDNYIENKVEQPPE